MRELVSIGSIDNFFWAPKMAFLGALNRMTYEFGARKLLESPKGVRPSW